jgi:hypothetical protein
MSGKGSEESSSSEPMWTAGWAVNNLTGEQIPRYTYHGPASDLISGLHESVSDRALDSAVCRPRRTNRVKSPVVRALPPRPPGRHRAPRRPQMTGSAQRSGARPASAGHPVRWRSAEALRGIWTVLCKWTVHPAVRLWGWCLHSFKLQKQTSKS